MYPKIITDLSQISDIRFHIKWYMHGHTLNSQRLVIMEYGYIGKGYATTERSRTHNGPLYEKGHITENKTTSTITTNKATITPKNFRDVSNGCMHQIYRRHCGSRFLSYHLKYKFDMNTFLSGSMWK